RPITLSYSIRVSFTLPYWTAMAVLRSPRGLIVTFPASPHTRDAAVLCTPVASGQGRPAQELCRQFPRLGFGRLCGQSCWLHAKSCKKRADTVGQPPSAEMCVSNMPALKTKKLRKLPQEKVLLEL